MKRKEIRWSLREAGGLRWRVAKHEDITLTFTRIGIEVSGYYDGGVSVGDVTLIPWEEVDEYRKRVLEKNASD